MTTGNRDVDITILNRLSDRDLVSACQTNKAYNAICNDQTFWANRIRLRFPEIPPEVLHKYRGDRT